MKEDALPTWSINSGINAVTQVAVHCAFDVVAHYVVSGQLDSFRAVHVDDAMRRPGPI
jgi:hypothetical protein